MNTRNSWYDRLQLIRPLAMEWLRNAWGECWRVWPPCLWRDATRQTCTFSIRQVGQHNAGWLGRKWNGDKW
jgi:hypothetical protein